jgi:cellobiose transport system substrate-binding protein
VDPQQSIGTSWFAHDEAQRRVVVFTRVAPAALAGARAVMPLDQTHIVAVYDVVEEDGRAYVVTEPTTGRSLDQVVGQFGPMQESFVAAMGVRLLDALVAAHAAGVGHGDVRPGSVLLRDDGTVKLAGLGLSPTGMTARLDEDLRGLAATLSHAVEGHASQEWTLGPRRAGRLAAVLDGLGAASPYQRWDAARARHELAAIAARATVPAPPPMQAPFSVQISPPMPPPAPLRRWLPWVVGTAAFCVLVMIAGIAAIVNGVTGAGDGPSRPFAGGTSGSGSTVSATSAASPPSAEPGTVLVVHAYGNPGISGAIRRFEASHPGLHVTIDNVQDQDEYDQTLPAALRSGTAGDVVALSQETVNAAVARPDDWADLNKLISNANEDIVRWAYQQGRSASGKLIALPYQTGGLAVCFRQDLFQAAGLPTDGDDVAARWSTWDKFFDVGVAYRKKTGKAMLDDLGTAFAAMLQQDGARHGGMLFADAQDRFQASSPALRSAWGRSARMVQAKMSAGLDPFSAAWSHAMSDGTAAATLCTRSDLDVMEDVTFSDYTFAFTWGMAPLPGTAGSLDGNWFGVPARGSHVKEAAELARFLAGKDGGADELTGDQHMMPTNLSELASLRVRSGTNALFNFAPTEQILADSVIALKPVRLGPHYLRRLKTFQDWLRKADHGSVSADAAFARAVSAASAI